MGPHGPEADAKGAARSLKKDSGNKDKDKDDAAPAKRTVRARSDAACVLCV